MTKITDFKQELSLLKKLDRKNEGLSQEGLIQKVPDTTADSQT